LREVITRRLAECGLEVNCAGTHHDRSLASHG
jgi:hypothetical protein